MRLAKQIIAMGSQAKAMERIERMTERQHAITQLAPMETILAKIPWAVEDRHVATRAKKLGVSRQTYYDWLNGKSRPNIMQAKIIIDLTGLTMKEIRGRGE